PTKQMGAATHAVGHNRTDNVLMKTSYPDSYLMQKGDNVLMQMRGVQTDIHSIEGGSPNPKPISMSLHGGPSVPRTSEEAQAIITAEANRRSGRDTINTKDKNIGSNPGGRVAQHGSPLAQDRPPVTYTMMNDKIMYPTIPSADSTAIKNHFKFLSAGDFDKKILYSDDEWRKKNFISSFDVTDKMVEDKSKAAVKDLNWLKNQYGMDALKGVRDQAGYGPKNNKKKD
ncbi:MAG: hypothetical protein GY787_06550, partial [Alteromonadales bacterium]|nr:hypothetical protein [Alteromonadales bacterium]